MGIQEETLRIKNEVVGAAEVKALQQDYYQFAQTVIHVSGEVYELAEAEKHLKGDTAGLADEQRKLIAALEEAAEHEQLAATATTKASQAKDVASKSARTMNTAIQQAAYGIGDFASTSGSLGQKLMSVSNNVQFVTAQMGPWGAGLGLVTVAVASAVTNWDTLRASLGLVSTEIDLTKTSFERLETQVEKLKDKKVKLAVDRQDLEAAEAELQRLKEGMDAFKAAEKTRSHYEKESGSQVGDVLAEAPGGEKEVVNKLRRDVQSRAEASSPELREARAKGDEARAEIERIKSSSAQYTRVGIRRLAELEGTRDKSQEEARTALKSIRDNSKATVGDLLKQAKEGDQDALKSLAKMLKESGFEGVAEEIQGSSARAIKEGEEEEKAFDDTNARAKAARERREYNAKLKKKAEAEAKQKEAEEKQKDQAALAKAKSDAPGLLESTASQIERGGDRAKAEADVRAMLSKAGLDKDEVHRATPQLMHEATGRAAKARTAKHKADAEQKKKVDAEQKKKVDEQARLLEPANLKQQAEAVYLQARDQGATHRQAAGQAQQFVNQSVRQLNPGLDARTSQGVSRKIGGDASADLQRRSMALQARGISGQAQALQIMGQLNEEVARGGQKLMAVERGLADLQRKVNARARSMGDRGGR